MRIPHLKCVCAHYSVSKCMVFATYVHAYLMSLCSHTSECIFKCATDLEVCVYVFISIVCVFLGKHLQLSAAQLIESKTVKDSHAEI